MPSLGRRTRTPSVRSPAEPRHGLQADGPSGVLTLTYYGIGTYPQAIDLSLTVPGQAAAGTYTSTLVVTMTAGP